MNSKITLFLMNEKGYHTLREFIEVGTASLIHGVISSEDNNVVKDYYNEIFSLCKKYNIPFYNKNDSYEIESDYSISIGWRWLIDTDNLIVFHDSLLPKYRGFAPLVSSLINGEKFIGVTALFASSKYDEGDIIAQKSYSIQYPIKIQEAIDIVKQLYYKLFIEIIQSIKSGKPLERTPQNHKDASYSLWRDEEDYNIDWSKSAEDIKRLIESTGFPYKGASSMMEKAKIRIFDAEIVPDVNIENRTPGKIIFMENGTPTVVCGSGLLKIVDAVFDESSESILPLKKFRMGFK